MATISKKDASNHLIEEKWDSLLQNLDDRKVIPIIGPELIQSIDPKTGASRCFYRELASRLADEESGVSAPSERVRGRDALHSVIGQIVKGSPPGESPRPQASSRLTSAYGKVSRAIDQIPSSLPEELIKFLSVDCFDFILTTCIDDTLEAEMTMIRQESIQHGSFWPKTSTRNTSISPQTRVAGMGLKDLQESPSTEDRLKPDLFYLFGAAKCLKSQTFAICENDILNWLAGLLEKPPQNLFDCLKDKQLLFLGLDSTDWITRFFVRIVNQAPLEDPITWGNLIADQRSSELAEAVEFYQTSESLNERSISFINLASSSTLSFLDELHQRWEKSCEESSRSASSRYNMPRKTGPLENEYIFISYSRETDVQYVRQLKGALDRRGIPAWFDTSELDSVGEDWKAQITSFIRDKRCSFFLPVISKAALDREEAFFYSEWSCACEERSVKPSRQFYLPVCIENDDFMSDTAIPEKIRKANHVILGDVEAVATTIEKAWKRRQRGS